MSSHENSQNNAYVNQTWSHHFSGEENMPRPPNSVRPTESRLLSRFRNEQSQSDRDSSNPIRNGNQSSQVTSQKYQQPLNQPEARSQLSADAKEFVPRSKAAFITDSYPGQYNKNDAHSLSVTAPEFVPRVSEGYNYSGPYYPNVPYEDYEEDPGYLLEDFNSLTLQGQFDSLYAYEVPSQSTDNHVLDRFNQALHILNMNPGNMEEYLRPICEMIRNSSDTTKIVNDVVESLFNQSLQETNFRYTGARICQFLNSNLKGNPRITGFNKIFVNRCQKEYIRCDELKNGSHKDQERLRGLAMFMAEIFLNVETETSDGTIQRVQFLPSILVDLIKTLLSASSDLDVKCSCQLLKLSGGLIEDVVKNSPEECIQFEGIFTQLQSLQSSTKLTENTKIMIGTVITLKECDWNRRSSSSPSKKSVVLFPTEPGNFQAPEPVFYNNVGAPCSRIEAGFPEEDSEDGAYVLNEEEEAAFLTWQAEQEELTEDHGALIMNDTGYDSYHLDEVSDEGGMGDELEVAYEEFLQKQNLGQGYQPHLAGPPQQQINTSVHQIFNHPPPNMQPLQEFRGYQPRHILPSNQLQHHQIQQQHQDQSQQQQYQTQYPNNDRYHYRRL